MARCYYSRFVCGHAGCTEFAQYESRTRAEQAKAHQAYGNGKWRCTRHSQPDEMLGLERRKIVHEIASRQEPHGRYWGHFGFVSGPGFRAFAKDFPAGTVLRVTAEVVLPSQAHGLADGSPSSRSPVNLPDTDSGGEG